MYILFIIFTFVIYKYSISKCTKCKTHHFRLIFVLSLFYDVYCVFSLFNAVSFLLSTRDFKCRPLSPNLSSPFSLVRETAESHGNVIAFPSSSPLAFHTVFVLVVIASAKNRRGVASGFDAVPAFYESRRTNCASHGKIYGKFSPHVDLSLRQRYYRRNGPLSGMPESSRWFIATYTMQEGGAWKERCSRYFPIYLLARVES